ncbi:MAG: anaerobic carbon-monoxide dehydrogenase catalytic subunit [Candidatus Brocadiae bacterium]|nr:anaerobic carbon-monoxide dehydrogenase catalytic subunit [Candidatus Brocadiia bacterium]
MPDQKKAKSIDGASQEMIEHAGACGFELAWDRYEAVLPQCDFGVLGLCCKNGVLGPCRIDPFGEGAQRGVCGATAGTIAARNLARHAAAGAAAHSDHGRDIVHTLLLTGLGKAEGYRIGNERKLRAMAEEFGIDQQGKDISRIAVEVAEVALADFGRQEGTLRLVKRAPEPLQKKWKKAGVTPAGIDADIVRVMHATHIGVDNEPIHVLRQLIRTVLSDGWGGSMYATDISDVLFGGPEPIRSRTNLGVLRAEAVNVVVHGHEPTLSEMIVAAAQTPEITDKAKEAGADGIQLAGMCCTAIEILMRHGIPAAGNFLQQELALATGAVDAMIVDVQCIMPAIADYAGRFPTRLISTSKKAAFEGIKHIEFDEEHAMAGARTILLEAIAAFKERDPAQALIPSESEDLVAGYTVESIFSTLGGVYRPLFRPLNHGIIDGRVRGVAGVVGCNNVKITHDWGHVEMVKELIRNDVAVLQTGCSAIACAKAGLMRPEAAALAGKGLREICEAVGIAPVLHVGSCVDNSRILLACTEMVKEGGIGKDICELPVAGAAPEWMSEKAVSIATYFAASGVFTVIAEPFPVMGSKVVREYLTEGMEEDFGGMLAFERDPIKAAHLMIDHINKKRAALGLSEMLYGPAEGVSEQAQEAAVPTT